MLKKPLLLLLFFISMINIYSQEIFDYQLSRIRSEEFIYTNPADYLQHSLLTLHFMDYDTNRTALTYHGFQMEDLEYLNLNINSLSKKETRTGDQMSLILNAYWKHLGAMESTLPDETWTQEAAQFQFIFGISTDDLQSNLAFPLFMGAPTHFLGKFLEDMGLEDIVIDQTTFEYIESHSSNMPGWPDHYYLNNHHWDDFYDEEDEYGMAYLRFSTFGLLRLRYMSLGLGYNPLWWIASLADSIDSEQFEGELKFYGQDELSVFQNLYFDLEWGAITSDMLRLSGVNRLFGQYETKILSFVEYNAFENGLDNERKLGFKIQNFPIIPKVLFYDGDINRTDRESEDFLYTFYNKIHLGGLYNFIELSMTRHWEDQRSPLYDHSIYGSIGSERFNLFAGLYLTDSETIEPDYQWGMTIDGGLILYY